jgi:glutathione S-transferase
MTSSTLKPIKVWGQGGPNPPKVAMVLEELGIPYEIEPLPISEVKSPKYLAINPNGRLPAIQDPNTGITLWESGAIVEYLIETYDKEYKLSFPAGTTEYFHAKQWLFFQTTGQGPYL